jgi:hypothetical protein
MNTDKKKGLVLSVFIGVYRWPMMFFLDVNRLIPLPRPKEFGDPSGRDGSR